jgi:hypothetical protein
MRVGFFKEIKDGWELNPERCPNCHNGLMVTTKVHYGYSKKRCDELRKRYPGSAWDFERHLDGGAGPGLVVEYTCIECKQSIVIEQELPI